VLAQVLVQVVLAKVVAETKGKAKDVVAESHLEQAQVAQAHEDKAKDLRKVKSKDSAGKLARIVVRDLVAGILQREQVQRVDLAINQVGVPLRGMDKLVEEVKEEVTINDPLVKDKVGVVVEAEALIKVAVAAAKGVEDNFIICK
jgi:hypothetical protein